MVKNLFVMFMSQSSKWILRYSHKRNYSSTIALNIKVPSFIVSNLSFFTPRFLRCALFEALMIKSKYAMNYRLLVHHYATRNRTQRRAASRRFPRNLPRCARNGRGRGVFLAAALPIARAARLYCCPAVPSGPMSTSFANKNWPPPGYIVRANRVLAPRSDYNPAVI